MAISVDTTWMDPIRKYLQHGALPSDPDEAKKLVTKAAHFTCIEGVLYKRGFNSPLLRCVDSDQAEQILHEVHEGIAGHHIGGNSLARKIIRAGYYWPSLVEDAKEHVKKCQACQLHSNIFQRPPEELHSLNAPWPFYQWGMDLIGPFPRAPGQFRFIIVAVDYFTKWVEAVPLATISSSKIQKFFTREIVARFGVPHSIVTDNGTQFTSNTFKQLMADFQIKHYYSSVEHPQTNGQAEAANRSIIKGIKTKLQKAKGNWVEILPQVLWSYRTTIHSVTRETPFRLTYGCDAVIPIERRIPSFRVERFSAELNDELMSENLTMTEEIRHAAMEADRKAKKRQAKSYNQKVNRREFEIGDLVLRRADIGLKNARDGKVAANWEGPYRVKAKSGTGGYRLETITGAEIPNSWNAAKLRTYYS